MMSSKQPSEEWSSGYYSHEDGEDRNSNPYPPGSISAQEWLNGWDTAALIEKDTN